MSSWSHSEVTFVDFVPAAFGSLRQSVARFATNVPRLAMLSQRTHDSAESEPLFGGLAMRDAIFHDAVCELLFQE
eukprot:3390993-Amphidinium_carterae.1